jgi:hypothetical protein
MAMDVLRIIVAGQTKDEEDRKPSLLLYNALSPDPRGIFRTVGLRKAARRDFVLWR